MLNGLTLILGRVKLTTFVSTILADRNEGLTMLR